MTTLTLALVALATVPESRRDALADVRKYAQGADLLVWATMVWYHDWSAGKMMTGDRGRTGRYSWTFHPDPDSADTATFDELVDCEPGTRGRIYSCLKVADMLSETARRGDLTTVQGVRVFCHSFGIMSGEDAVRVAGPLARKYGEDPARDVATVTRWVDAILHPATDDDDDGDTDDTDDTANGHDLGATASPTYAEIVAALVAALADYRVIDGDELIVPTDDDTASLVAVVSEWTTIGEGFTA